MKRFSYYLMAIFAILIGLYPVIYFVIDRNFGLLGSKSEVLLADVLWNFMFYTHIVLGGLALLIGWIQFNKKIRLKRIIVHRNIGKLYIISGLISAFSGIYIGLFATGGNLTKLGFICLGIIWFYTTYKGFTSIKNKNVIVHERMMIYSYAACFAAVTLRIWLPILSSLLGGFLPAYKMVAWLCWVPNIVVAHLIIKQQLKTN